MLNYCTLINLFSLQKRQFDQLNEADRDTSAKHLGSKKEGVNQNGF